MPRRPSIASAVGVADLLWPEFAVVDDLVFFSWCAPGPVDLTQWSDRTEVESTTNHIHILDCFSHKARLGREPWWDQAHPDFKAACEFGKRWAEAVASKLRRDLPGRHFFVYYAVKDNPIIRFHQDHPGEPSWRSEEQCAEEIARRSRDSSGGAVGLDYLTGLSL